MAKKEAAPKKGNGKERKANGKDKKELKGLIAAAEELNELMDFDVPIETEGDEVTEEYLVNELKETASQLEAEDEISDATRTTLTNIGATLPALPAPKKGKGKKEKPPKKEADPNKPKKPAPRKHEEGEPLSVFGHRVESQAGKIDELLASGKYTYAEIAEKAEVGQSRIKAHVKHLETKKGVKIEVAQKTGKVTAKKSK